LFTFGEVYNLEIIGQAHFFHKDVDPD